VLDFTSALYLGLQHPSSSLRAWPRLTMGVPAAFAEAPEVSNISCALAELQGCEAATLGTSTLHLAWDLFALLTNEPSTIFMDAGVYPITRWGVQRAIMRGAAVRTFPHHNARALQRVLGAEPPDRRPIVVTDGFCPNCGHVAPLADYLWLARSRGGLLIADDTQALGILGHSPSVAMPYGRGGGGSLRWSRITGPDALVFSSLAKGFGVPLAVLAASRAWIQKFKNGSLTRVHCSPPSIAVLRAAERALACNRREGDARREKLLGLVRRFQSGLSAIGIAASGSFFPIQSIRTARGTPATVLHERLAKRGAHTVLHGGRQGLPRISFLLTSRHTAGQIDAAVLAIAETSVRQTSRSKEVVYEKCVHR
jgi:8-amino-7-oxononanoate synthase